MARLVSPSAAVEDGLHVEHLVGLLLLHAHAARLDHLLREGKLVGREAREDLELAVGLAHHRAERRRDLDADGARAGDAHTQGVLDDVGREEQADVRDVLRRGRELL